MITVRATSDGQYVDDIFNVTVTAPAGVLAVVAEYPRDGSTVPLPLPGESLRLTVLIANLNSLTDTIKIIDRFGNDISDHAAISLTGLEIRIDPFDGLNPADLNSSEQLGRL